MDKKEIQRDFLELENTIKSRISYLNALGFTEEEKKIRKEEGEIILKKISKLKYYQLNPLQSVDTVHGLSFKIGDKFHIPGDIITKYTIVAFPDSVTVRGECINPDIGKPWVCEVYIEGVRKVEEVKTKRIKLEKKPKKVKIKVGDYFALPTNNTIYKAIEITKKKVIGTNKLQSKIAPKRVEAKLKFIIPKTKKEYKNQHKIERNYENRKD